MANPIDLSFEWKKSFSASVATPFCMLVSLYDLMYYYDTKQKNYFARANMLPTPENYASKGFELPHNIIEFDENLYQYDDQNPTLGHRKIVPTYDIPVQGESTFEDFMKCGYDISMPQFDMRSKPLFLTSTNVSKYIPGYTPSDFNALLNSIDPTPLQPSDFYYNASPDHRGLKIWDRSACLHPENTLDFYLNSANYHGSLSDCTWFDYSPDDTYKVATEKDGIEHLQNADLIVSNEDLSFESRFLYLPTDPSYRGIRVFNGMCASYSSINIWKIFFKYFRGRASPFQIISTSSSTQETDLSDKLYELLIKNVFVWVKASFYADYIDYRDFDQYLNKTSKVIHNEVLVTDVGDLDRYDRAYSEGTITANDYAKNTRPYISKVTPSVDLVAPLVLPEGTINPLDLQDTITKIIDDSNGPNSKVGALNIEPFEINNQDGNNTTTEGGLMQSPPVYFDPESRKGANTYSDVPIIVPKSGNVQSSGRFIGPTIDELWYEIKSMIAGRNSDQSVKPDGGYPVGEGGYSVSVDTRTKIKNHSMQTIDGVKFGDPIDISYDFSTSELQSLYNVVKWVNNPTRINYQLLKEEQDLNDLLCQVTFNGGANRKIPSEFTSLMVPNATGIPAVDNLYNPRDTALSLRELEGYAKGLRWNLTYLMSFLIKNNTWAGCVGYPNGDPDPLGYVATTYDALGNVITYGHAYNMNDGTEYQLHKNYLMTPGSSYQYPDTAYDQRDNIGTMPIGGQGTGLESLTSLMVGDNQMIVPSWSVYMGADGLHHSTYQATNVPILDEEF